MLFLIGAIAIVLWIVQVVCWILTLIKIFQNENLVLGIVSILCPLVALIMGFIKMKEWGHEKIMMIWGICLLVNIVLNVMSIFITPALV